MKQEQVIELAKKARVIDQKATMDSEYVRDIIADLSAFASLVEQVTLERVAKHLASKGEECEMWYPWGPSDEVCNLAKE